MPHLWLFARGLRYWRLPQGVTLLLGSEGGYLCGWVVTPLPAASSGLLLRAGRARLPLPGAAVAFEAPHCPDLLNCRRRRARGTGPSGPWWTHTRVGAPLAQVVYGSVNEGRVCLSGLLHPPCFVLACVSALPIPRSALPYGMLCAPVKHSAAQLRCSPEPQAGPTQPHAPNPAPALPQPTSPNSQPYITPASTLLQWRSAAASCGCSLEANRCRPPSGRQSPLCRSWVGMLPPLLLWRALRSAGLPSPSQSLV